MRIGALCAVLSFPALATGRLVVVTDPPGLAVLVDGQRWNAEAELAPGEHEVVVDDSCFRSDVSRVFLPDAVVGHVELKATPRLARLVLSAEDTHGKPHEGTAELDGQPLGAVPGAFDVPVCSKLAVVSVPGGRKAASLALGEGRTT